MQKYRTTWLKNRKKKSTHIPTLRMNIDQVFTAYQSFLHPVIPAYNECMVITLKSGRDWISVSELSISITFNFSKQWIGAICEPTKQICS